MRIGQTGPDTTSKNPVNPDNPANPERKPNQPDPDNAGLTESSGCTGLHERATGFDEAPSAPKDPNAGYDHEARWAELRANLLGEHVPSQQTANGNGEHGGPVLGTDTNPVPQGGLTNSTSVERELTESNTKDRNMIDGTESDLKDTGSGHDSAGEQTGWEDLPLSPEHVAMLVASGITPQQAGLRGYETVIYWSHLCSLRFTEDNSYRAPGLLIPLLDVDGQLWGYQFRADTGSPKYLARYCDPRWIDIPPGVDADRLGDPEEPLWMTEGVKKADCGAVHGLCIVDISRLCYWKECDRTPGKIYWPRYWRGIALDGRKVIICYDGDAERQQELRRPMAKLAEMLTWQGAQVSCAWLPDTETKSGLDDYLQDHTVDELSQLVRPFDKKLDGYQRKRKPSAATQSVSHATRESKTAACGLEDEVSR